MIRPLAWLMNAVLNSGDLNAAFDSHEVEILKAWRDRGAYDPDTNYIKNDVVKSGGARWLALQASQGVTPVEGASWSYIGTASGVPSLSTTLITTTTTLAQRYDRIAVNNASGGTLTLYAPTYDMINDPRMTINNSGDAGNWTVQITGGVAFTGGATSVVLAPGNTLEVAVFPISGSVGKWAKI